MKNLAKQYKVDIKGIKFRYIWMPLGMAFWTLLIPNTVFLRKGYDNWDMIDEVAHELTHRKQWQDDGTVIYLLKKTVYRFGTIFRQVRKLENKYKWNKYETEAYARQDKTDALKRQL